MIKLFFLAKYLRNNLKNFAKIIKGKTENPPTKLQALKLN